MIVLALVFIEAIINTIWLIIEYPDTTYITEIPGKRILVCESMAEQIITSLIYPFFLILIGKSLKVNYVNLEQYFKYLIFFNFLFQPQFTLF